jgi:outer membrane protein assembly factor BamB
MLKTEQNGTSTAGMSRRYLIDVAQRHGVSTSSGKDIGYDVEPIKWELLLLWRRRMFVKRRWWIWFLIVVFCVSCTSNSVATSVGSGSSTTTLATGVGSSTTLRSVSTTSSYVDPSDVSVPDEGDVLWTGGPTTEVLALDGAGFEIPAYQSFEFCGDRPRPAHVTAFSQDDGTEGWSVEIPWPAWSEARLVGERVVVLVEAGWGISGSAVAVETNGRSAWQTRLSWSPMGNPVVFDDLIVFAVRSPTSGAGVVALDSADGSVAWSTPLAVPLIDIPFGLVAVDHFVIVTDPRGQMTAIDTSTGTLAWRTDLGGQVENAALSDGADLYVVAGQVVYAVEGPSGEIRWRIESPPDIQVYSLIGVNDNAVVVVAENAETLPVSELFVVAGFDRDDGGLLWRAESSNWVVTGPDIVLTNQPGENDYVNPVQAWDPATGHQIWSVGFEAFLRLTSLDKDFVYLPGRNSVAQIRQEDGSRTWDTPLGGPATAPPVANSGSIYVAWEGTDGSTKVARIEQSTGTNIWTSDITDAARGEPLSIDETLIVLTANTLAHCA